MALVTVSATGSTGEELGLVVNSAGFLVIPSNGLKGGASILVTLGNGVEYVGQIVGEIPSEGLTVVHVNGATNLSTAAFASNGEIDPGSLAVAITSIKGASVVTTLRAMADLPQIGGSTIEKALTGDLNVASVALGTPLINGVGHVEGVVVGSTDGVLVVAPGSLVADEVHAIIEQQVFSAASLGITVTSQSADNGVPAGILISAEARNSSASSAGVATGDLIVGVNGITVTSLDGFYSALREAVPTSPLVLTVYTNQLPHTVIVPATVSLNP
jgi:S1-C subfamily serine protease